MVRLGRVILRLCSLRTRSNARYIEMIAVNESEQGPTGLGAFHLATQSGLPRRFRRAQTIELEPPSSAT